MECENLYSLLQIVCLLSFIWLWLQRPYVPKFGAWESNGGNGAAYTAVFDNARTGKGGKMINPNDPAENEALAGQMYGGSGAPQRNSERPPPRTRAPIDHGIPSLKLWSYEDLI